MCMFQTKRGSLVQTHLKMDVIERWTIQTINEQMGIPTMNDYVTYMGEAPGVDFCHVCAQVLAKHIQTKIMKVPPHSYGKFTTQLYLDQSSRGYIYIEPQQFWKGSVQLKPSTENAPPPPTKTKLQRNYHIYGKRDVTNVCAFFYYKDPEQRNIKNETGERSAA